MTIFDEKLGDLLHPAFARLDQASRERSARSRKLHRLACQAALVAADAASYLAAFGLMALLGVVAETPPSFLPGLGFASLATIAFYAGLSLYPGYRLHPHELLRRRVLAAVTTLGVTGIAAVAFLADWQVAFQIGLCLLAALLVQLPLRLQVRRLLRRAGIWGEDVDVLGRPDLADYFRKNWHFGIIPHLSGIGHPGAAPFGRQQSTVVTTAEILTDRDWLQALRRQYDEVIILADLPDVRVSGLPPASLNGAIGLSLRTPGSSRAGRIVRRVLSVGLVVPGAALLSPVILLAAVAIRLADPGPVFYRQAREGRDGTTIRVLKLRTMYRDAEQRLKDLLARDPKAQAEWQTHFKLKDDPRILPVVGGFLRSSSCDELPQLLNVIAGDMSLVGPRPFPVYHLEAMDSAFRHKRRSVTPGITGLWQVSERSNADVRMQQQLDDFYIENRSIWLDFLIILRTFTAVFSRNGAH